MGQFTNYMPPALSAGVLNKLEDGVNSSLQFITTQYGEINKNTEWTYNQSKGCYTTTIALKHTSDVPQLMIISLGEQLNGENYKLLASANISYGTIEDNVLILCAYGLVSQISFSAPLQIHCYKAKNNQVIVDLPTSSGGSASDGGSDPINSIFFCTSQNLTADIKSDYWNWAPGGAKIDTNALSDKYIQYNSTGQEWPQTTDVVAPLTLSIGKQGPNTLDNIHIYCGTNINFTDGKVSSGSEPYLYYGYSSAFQNYQPKMEIIAYDKEGNGLSQIVSNSTPGETYFFMHGNQMVRVEFEDIPNEDLEKRQKFYRYLYFEPILIESNSGGYGSKIYGMVRERFNTGTIALGPVFAIYCIDTANLQTNQNTISATRNNKYNDLFQSFRAAHGSNVYEIKNIDFGYNNNQKVNHAYITYRMTGNGTSYRRYGYWYDSSAAQWKEVDLRVSSSRDTIGKLGIVYKNNFQLCT